MNDKEALAHLIKSKISERYSSLKVTLKHDHSTDDIFICIDSIEINNSEDFMEFATQLEIDYLLYSGFDNIFIVLDDDESVVDNGSIDIKVSFANILPTEQLTQGAASNQDVVMFKEYNLNNDDKYHTMTHLGNLPDAA